MIFRAILGFLLVFCWQAQAAPIEAYGELPTIRAMALSPDGEHVAFLRFEDDQEALIIYKVDEGVVGAVGTDKVKARQVSFAGSDYAILRVGQNVRQFGVKNRYQRTGAFSFSLKSGKVRQIPKPMDELYPAQTGLGRIVGLHENGQYAFMPAFTGLSDDPPLSLLSVNLKSGSGRVTKRGRYSTIDWIVDTDGTVFAREDFNNDRNAYSISTEIFGGWKKLFEKESNYLPFSLVGLKPDKSGLILIDEQGDENYASVYELGFDGEIKGPVFSRDDAEVELTLSDINRKVIGVEYSGFRPSYEFYDKNLDAVMVALEQYFAGASVFLHDWTEDLSKLLLYAEGTGEPGGYYLFNRDGNKLKRLAAARSEITAKDVANVLTIEYKARDGLAIPALLTMPLNGATENAPLIVMPHGGPESHDTVGFHWRAQYFASRGYMIFQPNFRGSNGFGADFRHEGYGEWGGKMLDDIEDGVRALIKSGRADPARICIVGASYGGYAALAGGAFTPDLYKCIGAIAPVSDLPRMLKDERKDHGSRHWVYDYWKAMIGDPRAEKNKLQAMSPVFSAANYQAPVLLIHGRDDIVVPITQSRAMERALKNAGKSVEFVELKGEDHYLSTSETRLETLKALDAFVAKHIGAAPAN